MTQTALVPGSYDLLTAQQTFNMDGNGQIVFLGLPQNQPAGSRAFKVLSAVIRLHSNNSNGTVDKVYPWEATQTQALAFIVNNGQPSPGDNQGAVWNVAVMPPGATAVTISQIGIEEAGAGENDILYCLDSNREVVVPFGYNFGVWCSDSADGTPHQLTVTINAQIQWLEQPCAC